MKYLLSLCAFLASIPGFAQSTSEQEANQEAVSLVLNKFHQAAASADWENYFSLMSEDGVFLGTDVNERWTKNEFQSYASASSGWVYTSQQRNINFTPNGSSAWFDEILVSQNYGTSRGTGILIQTSQGWKISQYHLTFPIPNALVVQITEQIKQYESQQ